PQQRRERRRQRRRAPSWLSSSQPLLSAGIKPAATRPRQRPNPVGASELTQVRSDRPSQPTQVENRRPTDPAATPGHEVAAAARSAISSGETSSTWVAILHW